MKNSYQEILDPNNILLDDRSISDSIILFSGFAGITVFIGGLLANYFNHHIKESPVKYEITHSLMSFGAGIILSAVALVLIPAGMEELNLFPMILSFISGAIIFMVLDQYLAKKGGRTATLLAMLMDFIPESIALGAVFSVDKNMAILLSIFIGLIIVFINQPFQKP